MKIAKIRITATACAVTISFFGTLVVNPAESNRMHGSSGTSTNQSTDRPPSAKNQQLLREGERLSNLSGEFRISGDSVAFYPEEGEPMQVLENLALERIGRVLAETRGKREWLVNAIVTEYRGANYLLVQRAILKARQSKDVAR